MVKKEKYFKISIQKCLIYRKEYDTIIMLETDAESYSVLPDLFAYKADI